MTEVRKEACSSCPYRQDVPSGVWAEVEYDKLAEYDKETWDQPPGAFMCHATLDHYCHGWSVVHMNRGHEFELMALRLEGFTGDIPEPSTPLMFSGADAAFHGKADIENPSLDAIEMAEKLRHKYERLRDA